MEGLVRLPHQHLAIASAKVQMRYQLEMATETALILEIYLPQMQLTRIRLIQTINWQLAHLLAEQD